MEPQPITPEELLAALQGRWRTLRAIRHADGTRARFEGVTTWDGAACVEEGVMTAGGAAMPARRGTRWSVRGGDLVVDFPDGRPFHIVGGCAHHCPPDRYALRYDVAAWPRWSVRWRVTGPAKDYAAITRYRRD